jgi:type IV pilus assembly protein PilO
MALDTKLDLKNINIKNVYEWPLYGRMIVMVIVALVVFYCGYLYDFSSLSSQIYSRYTQEKDLKQQVKSILKNEEKMSNLVSQFPEMVILRDQWRNQLINIDHLPDLLNQILKLGSLNQIKFTLFVPGTKKAENNYFIVPIKVNMRGTYAQIAGFISQIANLSQIVVVSNFSIFKPTNEDEASKSDNNASDLLASELILEVYYLATKE